MDSRTPDYRVSVAPMMEWTDRHCRFFLRQFSAQVRLYTEMIHASAILRGQTEHLLRFSAEEHPLAIQLGGSDPAQLAAAARLAEDAGYKEVNLNCGCPSDKVRSGAFGACLMLRPALVAEGVAAMKAAVRIPVTVKFRIGVVERETEASSGAALQRGQAFDADDTRALQAFARGVVAAGADLLIVHARKAVLGGLSPHENRTVPPLRYDIVEALRDALGGGVPVVVNGGLRTADEVLGALGRFDGVMIGREAYHRPALLAELQTALHPQSPAPRVTEVLEAMRAYAHREMQQGTGLHAITRHMLGLLNGRPGARAMRQLLSADVQRGGDVDQIFNRAVALADNLQDEVSCPA